MKVTTLESVAGRIVEETLGVVRGSSTWSHRIMKSSYGGLRGLTYTGHTEMDEGLDTGRKKAEASMLAQARAMGADAIIGMKVEIIEFGTGAYSMVASGTAVKTQALPMATPAFQNLAHEAANDDDEVLAPFMMSYGNSMVSGLRH